MSLGRKNSLLAGSDSGGERAAAIRTVTEAKSSWLDPEDHFREVAADIAGHPVKPVHELLPWNLVGMRQPPDQNDAAGAAHQTNRTPKRLRR